MSEDEKSSPAGFRLLFPASLKPVGSGAAVSLVNFQYDMKKQGMKHRSRAVIIIACAEQVYMTNTLLSKLNTFKVLSREEERALIDALGPPLSMKKREAIIEEGDDPGAVHVLLEGWACRYKILPDGRQHIMAYLVPGDFCNVNVTMLERMDHSVRTLSSARMALITADRVAALRQRYPSLDEA